MSHEMYIFLNAQGISHTSYRPWDVPQHYHGTSHLFEFYLGMSHPFFQFGMSHSYIIMGRPSLYFLLWDIPLLFSLWDVPYLHYYGMSHPLHLFDGGTSHFLLISQSGTQHQYPKKEGQSWGWDFVASWFLFLSFWGKCCNYKSIHVRFWLDSSFLPPCPNPELNANVPKGRLDLLIFFLITRSFLIYSLVSKYMHKALLLQAYSFPALTWGFWQYVQIRNSTRTSQKEELTLGMMGKHKAHIQTQHNIENRDKTQSNKSRTRQLAEDKSTLGKYFVFCRLMRAPLEKCYEWL